MAAPRRLREEKEQEQEEENENVLLEAKRVRGQRRLLVVLEGASLETVKVRTEGIGAGILCGFCCQTLRALALGGEDVRAPQLRQA